jgi:glycosyltransferase involved in cell wall biosynthesis
MPDNLPLVSVIMPCYNTEKYFVEAIESIINQTYKNLEIVLINDGSTDSTTELLNQYSEKDKRIKIILNPVNLGLIASLNKGVAAATGDYIARMDADDISVLDRVEKIMNAFFKMPEVEVVSAANFMMNLKGKILLQTIPKATKIKALKFVSFFSTPIVHACVIVKSCVFKNNPFNPDYIHSEDYELFSRLIFQGVKMYNLNDPLYLIRINPDSVSFKYEKIQVSTHTKISKQNIENYFDRSLEYFVHKIMINRVCFDVSAILLKEAFKQLELLKTIFMEKEKCSYEEKEEIDLFLIEQKIDIIFQSIKYASVKNKVLLAVFLVSHADLVLNKRGFNYIKSKVYSKTISG